jgi:hypothetical protein
MGLGRDSSNSIPDKDSYFSLLYGVQTGSEVHPDFYEFGTFPGLKRMGAQADNLPPSSA